MCVTVCDLSCFYTQIEKVCECPYVEMDTTHTHDACAYRQETSGNFVMPGFEAKCSRIG